MVSKRHGGQDERVVEAGWLTRMLRRGGCPVGPGGGGRAPPAA
jgi:hypothetical protein